MCLDSIGTLLLTHSQGKTKLAQFLLHAETLYVIFWPAHKESVPFLIWLKSLSRLLGVLDLCDIYMFSPSLDIFLSIHVQGQQRLVLSLLCLPKPSIYATKIDTKPGAHSYEKNIIKAIISLQNWNIYNRQRK